MLKIALPLGKEPDCMKRITYSLTFILIFITSFALNGEDIRFRTIQESGGLASNHVLSMLRDSNGFMWFGTASGLNRFDGVGMKVFMNDPEDPASLHDNYVQDIQEDPQGNLWICAGDIYAVFEPRTETFRKLGPDYYKGIGMKQEAQIVYIDKNDMWLWARGDGLYARIGGVTRMVEAYDPQAEVTDIVSNPRTGHMYVARSDGSIGEYDKAGRKLVNKLHVGVQNVDRAIFSLFVDRMERLWVYSEYGAWVYDTGSGRWLGNEARPRLAGNSVTAIDQDAVGNIWIGYDNEGLEVRGADGSVTILKNRPGDITSLGNNSVESIYRDSDGGLWIATMKNGVSVYYPNEYKFSHYNVGDINCMASAGKGTVYAGTDHGELIAIDTDSHSWHKIPVPAEYGDRAITDLGITSDGTVWIGTYKGGMYRYRNGQFTRYAEQNGLNSPNIWAVIPMADGTVWIGTLGSGIQKFDPASGKFTDYNVSNSGLKSNYINTMTLGRDGRIYIGTTEGVSVLEPSTGSIAAVEGYSKQVKRPGARNVNQLMYDSRGLLWIATREGLYVYDLAKDRLVNVSLDGKSSSMFISGVAEGEDKTVWVTSGSSIYNVSVESNVKSDEYRFVSYGFGVEDGLSGQSFNQRSLCVTADGLVLAGDLSGILVIDPQKLRFGSKVPRLRFTSLQIGNDMIEPGRKYGGRVVLPENLAYIKELNLGAKQNEITISFSTDSYQHASFGQYEYILEGYDDNWRRCPRGVNEVHYVQLPPGHYTLKVRLLYPGIPADEITGELEINVARPWYAAWWMICVYVLLGLAVVGGVMWWTRRRERIRYLAARRKEARRKEIELNEMKFRFFTNVSHDLRTPLTLILSPVESLLNEKTEERDVSRLNTIKRNADRLLYLVNQLLDFRKNEMSGLHLNLSRGNLTDTVRKAMDDFLDMADRRNIDMRFESEPPAIPMVYDADKITKCVMNLLSNAMKYTPDDGSILVRVEQKGDHVEIAVTDSGSGIDDKDKKHIFERFYMAGNESGAKTGTGIGLSLVFEYVKLHGGEVSVEDNKPNGAVFRLTIPMDLKVDETAGTGNESEATVNATAGAGADPDATVSAAERSDRPSVLFVDDNKDLTTFLKDEFSATYDVDTASDGMEAMEMTKRKDYDLIVTDIMMPVMDGIKLTRELKSKKATQDIPVIMLTAKQDVSSVLEGLSLGADDYVTKPFNNQVLSLKIKRLVGLKRGGVKRSYIEPTPSEIEITSLDEQLVSKAVKYVEENMSRPELTVEEMSRELGMSRVHLYKKLVALTGKSPVEFIRVLRLKRAAQYLRESQMNVSEIAFQLGFNNPKYFSKYFKEEYGVTPKEYQDKLGK